MLHQRTDVYTTAFRLALAHFIEERCTCVIPVIRVVGVFRHQSTIALGVKILDTPLTTHLDVDITEERHEPIDAEAVVVCPILNMSHAEAVFLEHEVNRVLQQNVGVHQQESVGQDVPQLLYGHHVLVAAVVVGVGAYGLTFVRELRQFLFEVNHLALGVVDNSHARHLLGEWSRVGVIKHRHLIVLPAMLAQRHDCRRRQLGGVVVYNRYLLLYHSFLFCYFTISCALI